MTRVVALTGTPGAGKSTTAGQLARVAPEWRAIEVADLGHRRPGRARGPVTVDMDRASEALRRLRGTGGTEGVLVVGHLSHLLPIREVIVLRCRPSALARRLRRKGVGPRWVEENREAERLDVVLLEAIQHHRTIWELDTTRRSPRTVAEQVARILRGEEAPGFGGIDWLSIEPPKVPPSRARRARTSKARRGHLAGSGRAAERHKSPHRSR